jgi:4-carboxymuconolactone decarboxylase
LPSDRDHPMDDRRRHDQGMAVRRAVLGDPHVDRAAAATTELTADFQDLITRYAWGEIWSRPGLDRRTRSCITLAVYAGVPAANRAFKVAQQALDDAAGRST